MSAAWSIAYGREKEHAAELRAGLQRMQTGFLAEICGLCHGEGQYEQMYTAGCGGGYFRSMGGCDYCDGTGLRQGGKPAPRSVVEQVGNAGRIALAGGVS
ncbi:hypothetical protein [Mesorhizobium sp.]|uniref:hypothetical protein n=1 Tax=Mesorhizobium sp. TaxID=1871066 RepID=UPI000FE48444|nr:hypothetical protein [Mesorhizobium sp.]RWO20711.1 MAG: hypothetical protein EOS09_26705 [Mesorhizobium sp.]